MDLLALENKLSRAQRQLGALRMRCTKRRGKHGAGRALHRDHRGCRKDIAALEPAPAAAMADDLPDGRLLPPSASGDPHAKALSCGGKL
ncbi:MAG: hypothetical protein ACLR7U_07150 [Ruthenibacterium lactatiformans]